MSDLDDLTFIPTEGLPPAALRPWSEESVRAFFSPRPCIVISSYALGHADYHRGRPFNQFETPEWQRGWREASEDA